MILALRAKKLDSEQLVLKKANKVDAYLMF